MGYLMWSLQQLWDWLRASLLDRRPLKEGIPGALEVQRSGEQTTIAYMFEWKKRGLEIIRNNLGQKQNNSTIPDKDVFSWLYIYMTQFVARLRKRANTIRLDKDNLTIVCYFIHTNERKVGIDPSIQESKVFRRKFTRVILRCSKETDRGLYTSASFSGDLWRYSQSDVLSNMLFFSRHEFTCDMCHLMWILTNTYF